MLPMLPIFQRAMQLVLYCPGILHLAYFTLFAKGWILVSTFQIEFLQFGPLRTKRVLWLTMRGLAPAAIHVFATAWQEQY